MVLGEDLPVFHSTRFLPAMLLATSIYIDDTEPFSLPSGHHARVMLEPGYHTVYAKTSIYGMPGMPIGKQQIEVRAGDFHYLHYFEQGEGGFVVQRFVQQDAAVGAKAVASTKSAAQ